ncbi:hypothetical protein EYF80_040438 [Liparis tanakae]|uniref:Uncharacterized protein n=1 Tax=Liparis tanakae TaxID=230148 RepID=A0A4Z2G746_9TELE|nr:hypothetical protein EYF80_040438 [Liparis tanakae]
MAHEAGRQLSNRLPSRKEHAVNCCSNGEATSIEMPLTGRDAYFVTFRSSGQWSSGGGPRLRVICYLGPAVHVWNASGTNRTSTCPCSASSALHAGCRPSDSLTDGPAGDGAMKQSLLHSVSVGAPHKEFNARAEKWPLHLGKTDER